MINFLKKNIGARFEIRADKVKIDSEGTCEFRSAMDFCTIKEKKLEFHRLDYSYREILAKMAIDLPEDYELVYDYNLTQLESQKYIAENQNRPVELTLSDLLLKEVNGYVMELITSDQEYKNQEVIFELIFDGAKQVYIMFDSFGPRILIFQTKVELEVYLYRIVSPDLSFYKKT